MLKIFHVLVWMPLGKNACTHSEGDLCYFTQSRRAQSYRVIPPRMQRCIKHTETQRNLDSSAVSASEDEKKSMFTVYHNLGPYNSVPFTLNCLMESGETFLPRDKMFCHSKPAVTQLQSSLCAQKPEKLDSSCM